MITKAIVQEVIENKYVKVRIPRYNQVSDSIFSTPQEELYNATIAVPFNIDMNLYPEFE